MNLAFSSRREDIDPLFGKLARWYRIAPWDIRWFLKFSLPWKNHRSF
jgi:hypothetical protein